MNDELDLYFKFIQRPEWESALMVCVVVVVGGASQLSCGCGGGSFLSSPADIGIFSSHLRVETWKEPDFIDYRMDIPFFK